MLRTPLGSQRERRLASRHLAPRHQVLVERTESTPPRTTFTGCVMQSCRRSTWRATRARRRWPRRPRHDLDRQCESSRMPPPSPPRCVAGAYDVVVAGGVDSEARAYGRSLSDPIGFPFSPSWISITHRSADSFTSSFRRMTPTSELCATTSTLRASQPDSCRSRPRRKAA